MYQAKQNNTGRFDAFSFLSLVQLLKKTMDVLATRPASLCLVLSVEFHSELDTQTVVLWADT